MALSGAIVDLDGTVYRGETLIPGAPEAINSLRAAGLALLFFSNNPTRDGAAYAERLTNFGIAVEPGEACSAGVATTEYLCEHHTDDEILLVGAPGLRRQLRSADLSLTDDPYTADVLVGSWTPDFGYDDMVAALRAVDDDTTFVGTDPDRTFPDEDGTVIPGSGAVVNALAATVDREPDAVLGKPSEIACEMALDRLGVEAGECLVVGDRLGTDLEMGDRAGMTTVLVLSGITDRSDLRDSSVEPDYVIDSLADIDTVLADM